MTDLSSIGSSTNTAVLQNNDLSRAESSRTVGKLVHHQVSKTSTPKKSFLSRVAKFFIPSKQLNTRNITQANVNSKISQATNKKQQKEPVFMNLLQNNATTTKNKSTLATALNALKNNSEVKNSFKKINNILMEITHHKKNLQSAMRGSNKKNSARLELAIAQKKLQQAVNDFNSKSSIAGLEPIKSYDLEIAVSNGDTAISDEDIANLQKYEALKQALL